MKTETNQPTESPENEIIIEKISREQALASKWKSDLCGFVFRTKQDVQDISES